MLLPQEGEEWFTIPDYPDYEVSSKGRVRGRRGLRKIQYDKDGYPYVQLYKNLKAGNVWLHKLMCMMFNGPKPFERAQVLHRNGIKADIRPENLYWGTHQDNMEDMKKMGAQCAGSDHPSTHLNWDQVREIRRRAKTESNVNLAAEFGISPPAVGYIIRNISWKE